MGLRHLKIDEYTLIMHPFEDVVYGIYDDIINPPCSRNIKSTPDDISVDEAKALIAKDMEINQIAREAFRKGYERGLNDGDVEGFNRGVKSTTISINESLKRVKQLQPSVKLDDPYFLDKVVRGDFGKYKEDFDEILEEEKRTLKEDDK